MKRIFYSLALGWVFSSCAFAQNELDSIQILSKEELSFTQETTPAQEAKELTGLIEQEAFVNTSSFGATVGRPTIKGLRGNQVNIIHNDGAVGDVSALSDDHAVALVPLTTKRVEVLSGTRSLLYGSGTNGIRLIDKMDLEEDSELGNFGEIHLSGTSNSREAHLGAVANAVGEKLEILVAGDHRNAGSYKAGKGQKVDNSQMKSTQGQVALRYKPNEDTRFQVYYTDLDRQYGVPNPEDPAEINMRHKKYGVQWLSYAPTDKIDLVKFDISYQDYLHDELEDGEANGLFGLKTWKARLELEVPIVDWTSTWVASAETKDLKVCHSHGNCDSFTNKDQSGTKGEELYKDDHGAYGYSHADPLPNSKTQKFNLASYWEKDVNLFLGRGAWSWAANLEYRQLETDPININAVWQDARSDYYSDQNDWAFSLGTGLILSWNESSQWQFDLSYKERLPSVEELYWNGIDHAANSYYQGDYRLKKEKSANLEIANLWQLTDKQSLKTRGFYSYFTDYIAQQNLGVIHGFAGHNSAPVQKIIQKDVYFWGAAATHKWQFVEIFGQPLELTNQVEYIQAKFVSGGFVPRIAPASWTTALDYHYGAWQAQVNLTTQARAKQTASLESETSGHSLLGFYTAWQPKSAYGNWEAWLKGDNLLDVEAYDHTSFLKNQAPKTGRSFEAGISFLF